MDQVGPFRVLEHLGRGDFANVYKVTDEGGETYALKLALERSDARDRLKNEIDVLGHLDSPGIPKLIDQGEEGAVPYFSMTYIKGKTVEDLVGEKEQTGAARGYLETLHFIHLALEVLVVIHDAGWVHRDIKGANVLCAASMSKVSLIDFGFAKQEGATEAGADDSFWRAGSARCSPPAKLLHPRKAVASHDVFAVGVLAYRLLTGVFPWSVSRDQDATELREHMLAHVPPRVDERNSMVSPDVSRLVQSLTTLSDGDRPSSTEALAETKRLREETAKRHPSVVNRNSVFFPRVVRDPLYGDVRLTDYERDLLNTKEMQRLRYIKQLGLTNLVYPGAQHSRLAHAIGSVQRTEQILRSIEDTTGVRIETETRLVARIYALVHDVTHVPFGHTVEDELGIFARHDDNFGRLKRIVLDARSEIGALLRGNPAGEAALAHFDDDSSTRSRSDITDLVSGSTGADVLDYIDRDAFYCGLDHKVDSAIFRQFRLESGGTERPEHLVSLLYGKEGVRLDREYAVESLLSERYAMFMKVYCHKRKNAASALLDKALSTAISAGRGGSDPAMTEEDYERLTDEVVLARLAEATRQAAKRPALRLLRRELPRGVYRAQMLPEGMRNDGQYASRQHQLKALGLFSPGGRLDLIKKLAKNAKVPHEQIFLYCPLKAPGYQKVKHWLSHEPGKEQKADDVDSTFHEIKSRHLGLWELWVFCDGDDAAGTKVAAAAVELFGFPNRIEINPRVDRLF
jgi:HD superfamily phosphohydrolase/predicted Ser/Thr protein kinase